VLCAAGLHKRLELERIEPAFGAFWQAIARALPAARVVPIATGGHGTVESVRLWAYDAELAAADVLHDLDVHLVDPSVRADWFRLRGDTPIRVLTLRDVAIALRSKGLTDRWTPSGRTDALASDAGVEALWALLDVLLEIRDRSTQEARDLLRTCAIAPGWDSAIWPMASLYCTDQPTQDLLADVGVATTFLDAEKLGPTGGRLAQMVEPATPSLMLSWVEAVFDRSGSAVDEATRLELLRWFFKRWGDLEESDSERLVRLPIFPTATGPRPLVGLALPGDFRDELGLARVVAIDGIEEMRPFLGRLGAPRLTFARYCSDFIVDAVDSGELDETRRHRLLSLLAARLSEVQDDASVRAALRPLNLVPCTDGEWRPGGEVYLTKTVRSVVGDDVHLAAIPGQRRTAHEGLYRWLGAADQPRPRDVEARCNELRSAPNGHRQVAEAIIHFVGQQFAARHDWAEAHYERLRAIPWLPAEGDHGRGHAPHAVYTMFQRTLFASQARFLDISVIVQRGNAAFLEWLGVRTVPTPKQVVDHLLWSAERSEPVREDMWIYLNQNARDPALNALRGKRCLLIAETSTYVKPSEVYWQWHPFGRFRHQLGPKFAEYQDLLNRLDVAQRPRPSDAVDVLLDVAARHGGEPAPLLEEDVRVVQACWRMLSEGLDDETLAADELGTMRTAEVVLDGLSWLRRPGDVFFRDSHSLADRFGPAVHERLIDRPEGLWRALGVAGVRNLSDAVESRIVEQRPAGPGGVVADRLSARRRLLRRVLAAEDHDAMTKLEVFDENIEVQRLSRLVIQQALSVDEQVHVSEAYQRGALYLSEKQAILYVDAPDVPPVWVEIAREVCRALGVSGAHASGVAAAIKGLLGAETDEAARAELDELGYPVLDEALLQDAEPNVADDLGGSPAEAGDHVDHVDKDELQDDETVEQSEEAACDDEPLEGGAIDTPDGDETGMFRSGGAGGRTPESDGRQVGGGTSTSVPTGSGEEGSRHEAGRAQGSRAASLQSRLRSYVTLARDGTVPSADGLDGDGDPKVERAGVDAVLEFERVHGREPEEMPPNHPGFDIRSVDADGAVRVIEVKATADEWGPRGVAISSTQFATAQQRREEFWLYVVDRALTAPRVHPINDPATKIDQYFFDDGWQAVTEAAEKPARPMPPLLLPDSPEGVTGAVRFIDPADARATSPLRWVACQERHRQDSWFAVRIRGDALGMAYRGGVAYVEPVDRDVEDDELVLVVLHEQVDSDAGGTVTIRRWRPERDLAGNQLALRLWSDGSVEPLTVHDPDAIQVRGVVRGKLRLSDVEALGYC